MKEAFAPFMNRPEEYYLLLKRCSIQAVNAITRQLFAPRESQRINWLVKFHQRFNFDLNFSVIGPIKLISSLKFLIHALIP